MASLNAQDENIITFQPDLNQYAQIKQNKNKQKKRRSAKSSIL